MSTTVTLPDDLHSQVRALADSTSRTVEEVLAEAVTQALAYDRWFRAEAEKCFIRRGSGRRLLTPRAREFQHGSAKPELEDQAIGTQGVMNMTRIPVESPHSRLAL